MDKQLYSLELIEMMSGNNSSFVDKMVNMFIELTPGLLNRIRSGFNEGNHDEIKSASHKLISSIDMLEIESLKTVVRDLERMAIAKADMDDLRPEITYIEDILAKVLSDLKNKAGSLS